jgi:capsular polysaccharide biosynthesis protein
VQTTEKVFTPAVTTELDLKVYLRIIWHWAWLIALCTLTAGSAAYLVSIFSVPVYQATTTLLVDEARGANRANMQDLLFSERIARTYAEWMKRPDTLNKVAERLQIEPEVLGEGVASVSVTPIRDTQLMNVVVEGIWPELLPAVANTLPNVFWAEIKNVQNERFVELESSLQKQVNELTEQVNLTQIKLDDIGEARTGAEDVTSGRLRTQLAQQQATLATMRANLENLRLTKAQASDSIVIIEKAKLPTSAIRPRVMVNTLLAAIVGAMF